MRKISPTKKSLKDTTEAREEVKHVTPFALASAEGREQDVWAQASKHYVIKQW